MNRFIVSVFFILVNVTVINAQNFSRGCEIGDIDTTLIQLKKFAKSRAGIPSSYSLKNYAPSVGDQGNLGSCTSWASAYCAFTIVKRIESSNTSRSAFSALNLHNRLKVSKNEDPCSGSSYIADALSFLKTYGCSDDYDVCGYTSATSYYDDKLYDYSYLSVNTTDFKRSISENCPIVFAAAFYHDGWGKSSNLNNGVWSGYYSGNQDGAHAMTIIGYDDYKEGGSFLIQNSWGSSWGANGCFWMKYSDINKVIKFALCLIPDPEGSNDNGFDNYSNYENVNGDYFRINNNCSLTTYISLSQFIDENWETNGWYAINSGSSLDLNISTRTNNSFYWLATANKSNGEKVIWSDDVNGTQMCYDKVNVHKIYNNASSNCPDVASFYQDNPTSGVVYHTRNLTCPNVTTRGGEIEIIAENSIVKLSKDPVHISNLNWDGNTALLDPMSGREIESKKDSNGNEIFEIYMKKGKKVKKFIGSKSELIKLKAFKFQTENNATNWRENRK